MEQREADGQDGGTSTGRPAIAADIGGSFTDVVLVGADGGIRTAKVPSTPNDYAAGVVQAICGLIEAEAVTPESVCRVLHASTIATNAILEGKGARTALLTTHGFRDVLEMRRIRVPRLYEPLYVKPPPLVPRRRRIEITERLDARGGVVTPLDQRSVERAIEVLRRHRVEAVAVCFINAYVDGDHERRVGEQLRSALPDTFVSLSTEVLPEIREYERTSTTVVNAYVGPVVRRYLTSLDRKLAGLAMPDRLEVMLSSGGVADYRAVLDRPALLVEGGPAAGVIGAARLAGLAGLSRILTLDMGGTTAKASLVEDGQPPLAEDYEVGGGISLSGPLVMGAGYALRLPVIDIAEVGAGGGSIVRVDQGGALKVGPESAGAQPGPACHGLGGRLPTVTDANLLLGHLNPERLAGGIRIDRAAAERVLYDQAALPLGQDLMTTAFGIHTLANATMARAIRSVSTHRGRDPREFVLYAFGGGGGLHAATLARSLGIRTIAVPPAAGVLSALGLLLADQAWSATASHLCPLASAEPMAISATLGRLEEATGQTLGGPRETLDFRRLAALRFVGQAYELRVPFADGPVAMATLATLDTAFRREHEATYGHGVRSGLPIELVSLTVVAQRAIGLEPSGLAGARSIGALPSTAGRAASRHAYFGPDHGTVDTPIVGRGSLDRRPVRGPLLVEEADHTVVVPPDATVGLDEVGHVVITLEGR